MKIESPIYFGTESEYAVLGRKTAREQFARELPALCQKHYPMLRAQALAPDLFLPWGRLYVDAGLHPEWCTAEATDPWSVVYFQEVGERILSQIAEEFSLDIRISRHNVDCISHTTWGCHESYLVKHHNLSHYAQVLIPHLITRIIYTGAGGLDLDLERKTCQFLISPRANYYQSVIDHGSRLNRPLFHLKDESLSTGSKRLHLICGENLFSNTSNYLKIATTALIILLADHLKTMPRCDIIIDDTLESIRRLSADPLLKIQYTQKTYESISPLDIQRLYLELVYSKLNHDFMPPWARFACHLWYTALESLEKGWAGASQSLDWAIKLNQLEKKINKWGYSLLKGPIYRGLSEEQLYELLDYDLSFSQVGQKGLMKNMEKQGKLRHRIKGIPSVRGSKHFDFPVMGRAAVRAEVIDRLCKKPTKQYFASWTDIIERNQKTKLDLGKVDCIEEKWVQTKADPAALLIEALERKMQGQT